jgi:uncharacterized protein DUF4384/Sel1 repeat-containing protein
MTAPFDREANLRLADVLSDEVMATPGRDLMAEVAEDLGDRRALAKEFDRAFAGALRRTRARRIADRLRLLPRLLFPSPFRRLATVDAPSVGFPRVLSFRGPVAAASLLVLLVGCTWFVVNHFAADAPTVAETKVEAPPGGGGGRQLAQYASRARTLAAVKRVAPPTVLAPDSKGTPRDYAEAIRHYVEEAEKGDSAAMTTLGLLYANGEAVPRDYAKARSWYEKAAENGDAVAMTKLAFLYFLGRGVQQDYALARGWIDKAVEKKHPAALAGLGLFHGVGNGIGVTVAGHDCGAAATALDQKMPAHPPVFAPKVANPPTKTPEQPSGARPDLQALLQPESRVEVGACITVRVESKVAGYLLLFNLDAAGKSALILGKRAPTRVRAGEPVMVPAPSDDFSFKVAGPPGRNEIVAVILPEGVDLDEAAKALEGARSPEGFAELLAGIVRTTATRADILTWLPYALNAGHFEVVDKGAPSARD